MFPVKAVGVINNLPSPNSVISNQNLGIHLQMSGDKEAKLDQNRTILTSCWTSRG